MCRGVQIWESSLRAKGTGVLVCYPRVERPLTTGLTSASATTSSAAAASTAADTTLVPSGGAATELLPPSAAGASAAAVDSTSTSTSTTAATHFSVPARPPGLIAAAVISPIAFLGLLGLGVFLFRRRRQKQLKRASINTFMDQSGPHSPQIGGPLDVRHEKLPDFLNDILRQPENGSRGQRIPAYENPETLGPPTAGMGMGIVQPMGYERRVPTSPQHTTNHTRDPSVGYRSATPAGISGYENPETLGPPTVTRSGSTAAAAGYERRIAASLAPGSTAAYRSPTTAGIPAYENPALAYPGYPSAGTGTGTDDPFRDPITTQQTFSFPPPPSSSGGGGSGRGTPAPAPRSGRATPAPAPTLTRNSSLSAISERSRGSAARHGHDTQVEMRIAYRALRREVGDNGSDWGGSQQHSQHHQHSQQQMHNQQLMHQQVVPRRLM